MNKQLQAKLDATDQLLSQEQLEHDLTREQLDEERRNSVTAFSTIGQLQTKVSSLMKLSSRSLSEGAAAQLRRDLEKERQKNSELYRVLEKLQEDKASLVETKEIMEEECEKLASRLEKATKEHKGEMQLLREELEKRDKLSQEQKDAIEHQRRSIEEKDREVKDLLSVLSNTDKELKHVLASEQKGLKAARDLSETLAAQQEELNKIQDKWAHRERDLLREMETLQSQKAQLAADLLKAVSDASKKSKDVEESLIKAGQEELLRQISELKQDKEGLRREKEEVEAEKMQLEASFKKQLEAAVALSSLSSGADKLSELQAQLEQERARRLVWEGKYQAAEESFGRTEDAYVKLFEEHTRLKASPSGDAKV